MVIFDKNIPVTPEKVIVHVGHANRAVSLNEHKNNINMWARNNYKNVVVRDSIKSSLRGFLEENAIKLVDAGMDGVYEPNTLLGYAVLVNESNTEYKRLRLLKIKDLL